MALRILIVDDNALYRTAFRRNLTLRDFEVLEAENAEEALATFREQEPDVVVTDLSMRSPTEGLDLIRSLKQVEPLAPVVLISAVGTFEEGAEAQRLGAHSVISKARIDEELESLFKALEKARASSERNRALRREIQALENQEALTPENLNRLRELAADSTLHDTVRGEAFDVLTAATAGELRQDIDALAEEAGRKETVAAEARLRELIPAYDSFDEDSRKELRTAEFFFQRQGGDQPRGTAADFSRNIGFSYCFAVENEAKARLRKRLNKFLSNKKSIDLIRELIDSRTGQLDLFYHQHLARLQQMIHFDFTIDNVRQVFQRIMEHESRYKPDGLKALGIVVLCFGRTYEVPTQRKKLKIENPLGIRGLETEKEVVHFAHLLVALQHYRNPYIHPEISEMEKVSKIRETAIECLNEISKLV